MQMEAEIGMRQLQAKGCLQPCRPGDARKDCPLMALEGASPADTWIPDICPAGTLRKYISAVSSHKVYGSLA